MKEPSVSDKIRNVFEDAQSLDGFGCDLSTKNLFDSDLTTAKEVNESENAGPTLDDLAAQASTMSTQKLWLLNLAFGVPTSSFVGLSVWSAIKFVNGLFEQPPTITIVNPIASLTLYMVAKMSSNFWSIYSKALIERIFSKKCDKVGEQSPEDDVN